MIEKILSLPKTIWFNLRYLPFKQAIRFPIAVHYNTTIKCVRGGVIVGTKKLSPFLIRIGFHKVPIMPEQKSSLDIKGTLVFDGSAHIGRGSRIVVRNGAILELGDNFAISASSYINCYKHIKIGKDCQLSWGDLLMDSDAHVIYGEEGSIINESKEIIIGDKIWIGCDSKVLKGVAVPNNCVIGANSIVTAGSKMECNSLIIGSPAKSIKKIKGFKI